MPAKKPAMRKHPIALGRGAKWWREQVRRNVSAIFDGLVRKGAKADRATMSKAYAFAIGGLVKHGYLKRTAKGLMVTDKGLAKSREKLRTVGARKKHEHYERQLALVRKPRRGRARRNPAPDKHWPDSQVAREIVMEEVGSAGASIPRVTRDRLVAEGWPADEVEAATVAQILVVASPSLYEAAMRREEGLTQQLTSAARGPRKRALPAYLTAEIDRDERAERELPEFAQKMLETDPEGARKLGIFAPAERAAIEEARKMRRYEMREIGGRAESYRFQMAQGIGANGKDEWVLVSPAMSGLRRTAAQTKTRRAMGGLRKYRIREMVEADFLRDVRDIDGLTGREILALLYRYYEQHKLKYEAVRVSAGQASVRDFMIGLSQAEENPVLWPLGIGDDALRELLAPFADEATRLYMVQHTRGNFDPVKVPGGWDLFWTDNVTASRAYVTQARGAAANARLLLDPLIVGRVQILRPEVERALMMRSGVAIGEKMAAETLKRRAKRQKSATTRREKAALMAADPMFHSLTREEQAERLRERVLAENIRLGRVAAPSTFSPVTGGGATSFFTAGGFGAGKAAATPAPTFTPFTPAPPSAPETPDFSKMTLEEITAFFARKNRGTRRR